MVSIAGNSAGIFLFSEIRPSDRRERAIPQSMTGGVGFLLKSSEKENVFNFSPYPSLMLEGILGYMANGAVGAAGAGLVVLNRGLWHDDKERGVHVATEYSLSARIIKHFSGYRHISSTLDHFIEGVAMPYAFIGFFGTVEMASQYIGFESHPKPIQPEVIYSFALVTAVFSKALLQLVSVVKQRRRWDGGDYAQLAADITSVTASGFLLSNGYRF